MSTYQKKQKQSPRPLTISELLAFFNEEMGYLDGVHRYRWELIKLYLKNRLEKGGDFSYTEIAEKAVRFAYIVSDAIDKSFERAKALEKEEEERLRQEEQEKERKRTAFAKATPEEKERIYQEFLKREEGKYSDIDSFTLYNYDSSPIEVLGMIIPPEQAKEMAKRAQDEVASYTSLERLQRGLVVKYADLPTEAQESVFSQWLEYSKDRHHTDEKFCRLNKIKISPNALGLFHEKRSDLMAQLTPFERAEEWGEIATWDCLSSEEQEQLHQRYLTSVRENYAISADKSQRAYCNFIIPAEIMHNWREEYKNKTKEAKQ